MVSAASAARVELLSVVGLGIQFLAGSLLPYLKLTWFNLAVENSKHEIETVLKRISEGTRMTKGNFKGHIV